MSQRRPTTDNEEYQKTVLPSGLRIVTETMPSVHSVSLGVWVDVGSRHERAEQSGITHFIEHMLFKGTRHRSARDIAAALESLGGSLNGFTSREHTCYTARVLDEHLPAAVDVLADMTCSATLTAPNLKREKMVIAEEIKEVEDTPADYIHDFFSETYWGTHPLGRSILGSADTVTRLTRKQTVDYLARNYRTGSVVIVAAGRVDHRKLVRLAGRAFDFRAGQAEAAMAAQRSQPRNVRMRADGNSQTHLCLGFPGLSFGDPDRMTALALNTYLGSGMSSVLFQKIRERHGLAYSIYAFHDFYSDAGVVGAYLGTDRRHLARAVRLIMIELKSLKKRRLTGSKLHSIKTQMKGQLALGLESPASRMNRLARMELMHQPYRSYRQMLNDVDRITSSRLLHLANRLFDSTQVAVAVLGPADENALDSVL